jgi:radical SAM superfamily enzyme YgiQ (UPF0313 family)
LKALLINPKSPNSFWSLEHVCRLKRKKALLPPLGLITAAGLLPRDWELKLVDMNARSLTDDHYEWADLVMISGMLVQKDSMLHVIRESKRRGKPVVVGGPYPTALSRELMDAGCDVVVKGESETLMPRVISAIRENRTKTIIEDDEKPDMNQSVIPRFDLLNMDDYVIAALQTSRGCPFDCEFCDITKVYGRKMRYKSPDRVVAELEALLSSGFIGEIFLCDDNFIGNRIHAKNILDKIIPWNDGHGEPFCFFTQVSIHIGQDIEMMDLMTQANFTGVLVGVESPDEKVLNLTGKQQNISNSISESLHNICINGLDVVPSLIIGMDGEDPGVHRRIIELIEANNIPLPVLNMLQVLPNTKLWERLKREGRLLEEKTSGQTTAPELNFIPARPVEDIIDEYLQAWDHLYDRSNYLNRSFNYYLAMRPTRMASARQKGKTPPPARPQNNETLANRLRDASALLKLCWWQGIRSKERFQYWRQLVGIIRRNPSRKIKYLNNCAVGESVIQLIDTVKRRYQNVGASKNH